MFFKTVYKQCKSGRDYVPKRIVRDFNDSRADDNSNQLLRIMLYLCLTILFLNNLEMYFVQLVEHYEDYQFPSPKLSLEQQLKNRLTSKKRSDEKFRKLNEHLARDTEYFEEIPHFAANSSKSIKRKQANIENDFKKLIGMVGYKYTYKRDLYWRTWRKVDFPNKTEFICYRCQNVISTKSNCTNCNQGGYWMIEENQPPCSFFILSFKNEDELCVAYFWQFNSANISSCPSVIPYDDLSACGVPLITNFLVTKDYSKPLSERALPDVCQGRERCDISTVYVVRPKSIIFRIINANNIVYSRIIKQNGTSYVCVKDCGIFDFVTMSATRKEDHLSLDLLSSIKKKRNSMPNHSQNKKGKMLKNVKSRASSENFIVKKHKYILETPFEEKRINPRHKPSMCKQILLKELMKQQGYSM